MRVSTCWFEGATGRSLSGVSVVLGARRCLLSAMHRVHPRAEHQPDGVDSDQRFPAGRLVAGSALVLPESGRGADAVGARDH